MSSSKSVADLDEEFEKLVGKLSSNNLTRESADRLSEIALEKQLLIYDQLKIDFKLVKQKSKLFRNPREAASLLKVKYENYGRLLNNLKGFMAEIEIVRSRGFELLKALHDIKSRFDNDVPLSDEDREVFKEVLKY